MIGNVIDSFSRGASHDLSRLTFSDPLYNKRYKWRGNKLEWNRCPRYLGDYRVRRCDSTSVETPRGKSDRTSKDLYRYTEHVSRHRYKWWHVTMVLQPVVIVAAHDSADYDTQRRHDAPYNVDITWIIERARRDSMSGNSTRVWNIDSDKWRLCAEALRFEVEKCEEKS